MLIIRPCSIMCSINIKTAAPQGAAEQTVFILNNTVIIKNLDKFI